jgi:hypothetical protein
MKKAYIAPKLTVHGSVEDVTNAFGTPGGSDTVQYAGQTFPGSLFGASGSINGGVDPV